MKKRILSLFLAVLMTVTALPLFLLPAVAEGTEATTSYPTEEAYNALYVQEGLTHAIDFFFANAYWNTDNPMPTVPYLREEFDEESERWDIVYDTDGVTELSRTLKPIFKAACTTYFGNNEGDPSYAARVWMNNTAWKGSGFALSMGKDENVIDEVTLKQNKTPAFYLAEGYIQFVKGLNNNVYLSVGGEHAGTWNSTYTMQAVMTPAGSGTSAAGDFAPQYNAENWLVFRGIPLKINAYDENNYKLVYCSSYSGTSVKTPTVTVPFSKTAVATFTMISTAPEKPASGTATGKAELYYNGTDLLQYTDEALEDANVTYGTSSNLSLLFNYRNSTTAGLYALRIYSRSLTDEEMALNHFADLVKYYKLDFGFYDKLTDSERVAVAESFLTDTVGLDEAYRAQLQERVTEEVDNEVYGALLKEDTVNPSRFDFADLAKELRVDIQGLRVLPVEYRQTVYGIVLSLADKSAESVQAALESAILTVIEENYGDYINQNVITYKDLYVKQDHLTVWVDFFAARESDGYVYDTVSYQDEATQNLKAADRVTTVHTDNPEQPYNMDQLFAKYRFRGGDGADRANAFFMVDISSAGWAHTNIRKYGDGCLECGFNNSVGLYSPGKESDVTYQIVAGVKDKNGGFSGAQAELQLDGLRTSFRTGKSNDKITAYVGSVQYFGFGAASYPYALTLSEGSAIRQYGQTKAFSTVTNYCSSDITLVLDKKEKETKSYTIDYYKDEHGNLAYTAKASDIPAAEELQTDGTHYVYRTSGIEKLYIDIANGSLYWMNGTAKNTYFFLVDKGNSEYAFRDGNGNEWMTTDEASVDKGAKTATAVTADSASIALRGPYYDTKSVKEVADGTAGFYGPYQVNMMDVYAYGNGSLLFKAEGLTYTDNQPGSVGNRGNLTLYAARVYDCTLTETEIKQNHFADLAGYYGFDLSLYPILTEAQREKLFDGLMEMQLGDDRVNSVAKYEALLFEMLYSLESESKAALSFRALCENYFLNVTSLMALSAESRERVFESFSDVDPESLHYNAILQARLEKAVENELLEHYEEATIHKTIDFSSWQLHVYGTPGFRAVFRINEQHLSALTARDTAVTIGIMVAEKGNEAGQISSAEELTLSVGQDGSLVFPEGVVATLAYENGHYTDSTVRENGEVFFSESIFPEEEAYGQKYYCTAFVMLKTDEGVFIYLQNAPYGRDNAPSLGMLSEQALALNWAYPNVQTVLTKYLEEEGYSKVSGFIGNTVLSDFRVSFDRDAEAVLEKVNALTNQYFGVSLMEGESEGPTVYIGKFDFIYKENCYGVSVHNGDLYLWYNDEAHKDRMIELLGEILSYHYETGGDCIVLPVGFNEIRMAQ